MYVGDEKPSAHMQLIEFDVCENQQFAGQPFMNLTTVMLYINAQFHQQLIQLRHLRKSPVGHELQSMIILKRSMSTLENNRLCSII